MLRYYQLEAIQAVHAAWDQGQKPVLVMATGTGKTETALGAVEGRGRVLWLVQQRELVDQVVERVYARRPALTPAARWYGNGDNRDALLNATLVAATVQSAQADPMKAGRFDVVVVDECHHAVAPIYAPVLEAHASAKLLGLTATPFRTDKVGLQSVFDTIAYRYGIVQAVQDGYLVPFIGYQVFVDLAPHRQGQDYTDSELERVLNVDNVHELLLSAYRKYAEGPTIIFTPTVEMAGALAAYFNAHGVSAAWAHGGTQHQQRTAILDDFRKGKTQVLVNCSLWTEGLDLPMIQTVMVARPTTSDLLYVQMVGRGLRTYPGKERAVIIDLVGQDRDLFTAGDLTGLPRPERKAVSKAAKQNVVLDVFVTPKKTGRGVDADPDALRVKVLDWLATAQVQWTYSLVEKPMCYELASASLDGDLTLAMVITELPVQGARVRLYAIDKKKQVRLIGRYNDPEDALHEAQAMADAQAAKTLAHRGSKWRNLEPTDKQLALARRLGIPTTPEMSRGQVAQAITHRLAELALRPVLDKAIRAGMVPPELIAS